MNRVDRLMIFRRIGIMVVALLMTGGTTLSQVPRDTRPQPRPDGEPSKPKTGEKEAFVLELDRKAMERDSQRIRRNGGAHTATPTNSATRELTQLEKGLLSPTQEDLARFATFLKLPDTGLIRLLPKGKYEYSNYLVSASDAKPLTLPVTGGGAAYSFTKKRHELSEWSEIALQDGKLFSGFSGGALGFIANLGDVPLEGISLKTPGVADLQKLGRPRSRSEAVEQSQRNSQGFMTGSFTYYSVIPGVPGFTYVLRSVAEGRADLLIAFRLCRKDEDGSLIILWKLLKKDSAPYLK
jgi:hypothetical protein